MFGRYFCTVDIFYIYLDEFFLRSESCPHCRHKVKQRQIQRLYFNFSNTESVTEDSFTLQQRVDNLLFQVKLKEKEIANFHADNDTLKKLNSGLRREVKRVENEVQQKNSAIHALKEQTIYFKHQSLETDSLKDENARLKARLEKYHEYDL